MSVVWHRAMHFGFPRKSTDGTLLVLHARWKGTKRHRNVARIHVVCLFAEFALQDEKL